MFDNNITAVTIGIRFQRAYRVLDQWGSIFDTILDDNDFFNSEYFPRLYVEQAFEKVLIDTDKNNYFKITQRDIIFQHSIEEDYVKEYQRFKDRIMNFLVPKIFLGYNINNIERIGCIYEHKFNKDFIENVRGNIFQSKIINAESIRFSIKDVPIITSKTNVNDYINKIFAMRLDENNNSRVSFDYQRFFKPMIKDIRSFSMEKYFLDSSKALIDDLYSMFTHDE